MEDVVVFEEGSGVLVPDLYCLLNILLFVFVPFYGFFLAVVAGIPVNNNERLSALFEASSGGFQLLVGDEFRVSESEQHLVQHGIRFLSHVVHAFMHCAFGCNGPRLDPGNISFFHTFEQTFYHDLVDVSFTSSVSCFLSGCFFLVIEGHIGACLVLSVAVLATVMFSVRFPAVVHDSILYQFCDKKQCYQRF